MAVLIRLARAGIALGALGASLVAVLAVLGFAVPLFDVFNHLQPMIFAGTLLGIILVALAFRGSWMRPLLLAVVATGFVASAIIVVPEAIGGLLPRPALPTDGRPVFKVMTHNVFARNYDMTAVAAVIDAEDPDIIAFQEFLGEQGALLKPLLGKEYPYSAQCRGGRRANLALFSKIPFEQVEDGACPTDAYGDQRIAHIIAKFTLDDGTTFNVMTTHLDWPAPKMARQRDEFADLAAVVRDTDAPLILVGDFNSTPWSYALREFAHDAHLERQTRSLVTYPMLWYYLDDWRPMLPFLPLDHVMTKGDVAVHEVRTTEATSSDHLPVVFTFSVTPLAQQAKPQPAEIDLDLR